MRAAPWKGGASAPCGLSRGCHSESSQPAGRREARNLLLFLAAPRRASGCLLRIRLFQHATIGGVRAAAPVVSAEFAAVSASIRERVGDCVMKARRKIIVHERHESRDVRQEARQLRVLAETSETGAARRGIRFGAREGICTPSADHVGKTHLDDGRRTS
jgi:hypothetical protein